MTTRRSSSSAAESWTENRPAGSSHHGGRGGYGGFPHGPESSSHREETQGSSDRAAGSWGHSGHCHRAQSTGTLHRAQPWDTLPRPQNTEPQGTLPRPQSHSSKATAQNTSLSRHLVAVLCLTVCGVATSSSVLVAAAGGTWGVCDAGIALGSPHAKSSLQFSGHLLAPKPLGGLKKGDPQGSSGALEE